MSTDILVLELTEEGLEYWENYARICYSGLGSAFLQVLEERRKLKRQTLEMEETIEELRDCIDEYRK